MKKNVILVIFMALFNIKGQITLTQSNHAPVPGDIRVIKEFDTVTNIINVLNVSGSNVLYDFSQKIVPGNNTFTESYVTPSVLPGSNNYITMGANVAFSDSGGFYKSSTNALEYCGHMNSSGEKMEFLFDKPILMNYPFSYNSFFTDFAQGTMNTPISPPFNLTATITCSGFGQGTLQLPGNPPLNNVLLIKRNIFMLIQGTGSLSTVTGTQTITEYEFYSSGSKFPIMLVRYENLVIPAFGKNEFVVKTEYDGSIILNFNEAYAAPKSISIVPQPADAFIRLSGIQSEAYYTIFDIKGKKLKAGLIHENEAIELINLPEGLYIIELRTITGTYRKKLIKN